MRHKILFPGGLSGIWKVREHKNHWWMMQRGKNDLVKITVKLALTVSPDNILKYILKRWMGCIY